MSRAIPDRSVQLWLQEVGHRVDISPAVLQQPEWATHVDVATRNVALTLRGYMLTEEGGKTVTHRTFYWQKLRPWWLPKFMWRRVPEQQEVAVASARPVFTYPQANVLVPDLGPVVFKVLDESYKAADDD